MAVKCLKCAVDNSSDSKFCRECGAPLTPAPHELSPVTRTIVAASQALAPGSIVGGRNEIEEELGNRGAPICGSATWPV